MKSLSLGNQTRTNVAILMNKLRSKAWLDEETDQIKIKVFEYSTFTDASGNETVVKKGIIFNFSKEKMHFTAEGFPYLLPTHEEQKEIEFKRFVDLIEDVKHD